MVEAMLATVAAHGPGLKNGELKARLRREEAARRLVFDYGLLVGPGAGADGPTSPLAHNATVSLLFGDAPTARFCPISERTALRQPLIVSLAKP